MKDYNHILIRPQCLGYTPRLFGVNVEIQEHWQKTNLWDWIADAGITTVREFHPEQTLRKQQAQPGDWGAIANRSDFDAFRKRLAADPDGPAINWDNYRFDTEVPWMGVPDGIATKLNAIGITPLYSLGYGTRHFVRPIIYDLQCLNEPNDDQIDWEAATSAYTYYYAVIRHFAARFNGTMFMMVNEPENRTGWFHLPEDLADCSWADLFWDDQSDRNQRYCRILAAQYAVLARMARTAMDDVKATLDLPEQADAMQLIGPTTVLWQPLWEQAGQYLDTLDFHHYHPNSDTLNHIFSHAAAQAQSIGRNKKLAISEFNRYSGSVPIDQIPFATAPAIETAKLLLHALALANANDPPFDFATFYLLHFPSTHRNYKHLLYGDMNLIDWTGRDRALWSRGTVDRAFGHEAWHPGFQEQQVRFATPAYHLFRMIARNTVSSDHQPGPFEILKTAMANITTSGPADIAEHLHLLCVRQSDRLLINLLNTADRSANAVVDLSMLNDVYAAVVIRRTDANAADQVVQQLPMQTQPVEVQCNPLSLTQIIFTQTQLDEIRNLHLVEQTFTPGNAEQLELYQTTRLRAVANHLGGELDLTELNTLWISDDPDVVRVDQGGLVQRMRNSDRPTTITAQLIDGNIAAQTVIHSPDHPDNG